MEARQRRVRIGWIKHFCIKLKHWSFNFRFHMCVSFYTTSTAPEVKRPLKCRARSMSLIALFIMSGP